MEILYSIAVFCGVVFLYGTWRVLNWVWLKPKKLEKRLREQGFKGNSYRILYGDMKDMRALLNKASSKPIGFSDDIVARVIPHFQETVKKYGTHSFFWSGPKPQVLIMDPDLIIKSQSNVVKESSDSNAVKESSDVADIENSRDATSGVVAKSKEKQSREAEQIKQSREAKQIA